MTKQDRKLQYLRTRYRKGELSASEYVAAVSKVYPLDSTRKSIMRKIERRLAAWTAHSG